MDTDNNNHRITKPLFTVPSFIRSETDILLIQPSQPSLTSALIYSEPSIIPSDNGTDSSSSDNCDGISYDDDSLEDYQPEDSDEAVIPDSAKITNVNDNNADANNDININNNISDTNNNNNNNNNNNDNDNRDKDQSNAPQKTEAIDPKSLQNDVNVLIIRDCTQKKRSNTDEMLTSELEIDAQHYRIQKRYSVPNGRRRHLTDIDFEGILNLIGGCNMWQIIIYVLISTQQIPHAMFNLNVVYMMYQPDHWCKMEEFSKALVESNVTLGRGWSWEALLNSSIAFPYVKNRQRGGKRWHEQCYYYDRGAERYREFMQMDFEDARDASADDFAVLRRCSEWDYDRSVMKETVVTQWHRVCDENWSRAHVHLSYSLGYIAGCMLGGFVSDRYGRKTAICAFGILSSIFGFLLPFTKEFEVFLVIRFLGAVCNEAADLAAYVLCMEITGVKYRSIIGSLLQAPWACGYAFLALVAYLSKSWYTIQIITVLMHTFAMILINFLPESPRWLIVMNRVKEAERIIRHACHLNKTSLPSDLGLVRHAEKRKWLRSKERPHFLLLFISSDLRIRSICLFVIWIAIALVYYGLVIALSDQSSPGRTMFVGHFFLNNAIAGAIELPTLMGCVYLLRFGRKRSQTITLIAGGILIGIAIMVSTQQHTTLALMFMLAGKVCIQGAFNILYIFTSELYPTIIRNSAVGVCSMVSRMGSAASGYIAILSDVTLPIVPMLIFSIFSLVAGSLVMFLPETQDIPLPETIWDAVTMLKTQNTHKCMNFNGGNHYDNDNKEIYGEREESESFLQR